MFGVNVPAMPVADHCIVPSVMAQADTLWTSCEASADIASSVFADAVPFETQNNAISPLP